MSRPVLLATCAALPDGDEDADILEAALADAGVDARWVPWTEPIPADDALIVLRSTWDYTDRLAEFLNWVATRPRIANPGPVVEWNTDKLYLLDLAKAGVPIVPTTVVAPGDDVDFAGHAEFVVKPSVGTGSRGTGRFAASELAAARKHVARLHGASRVVLVQPYLDAIDTAGETALIYVDGEFSHAIRKDPMLPASIVHPMAGPALYVEETIEARAPSDAELAVGAAITAAVRTRFGADQLYARVDLLPGPDGPVLVELELTEPSLFLQHSAGAAKRFAAAIAARA
jgi:hypothetical protein